VTRDDVGNAMMKIMAKQPRGECARSREIDSVEIKIERPYEIGPDGIVTGRSIMRLQDEANRRIPAVNGLL